MSEQIFSSAFHCQPDPSLTWDGIGIRMPFAADEEIFAQEEEADLFYQVIRGTVRTTRLLSDGRRQIVDFYYPGDLFGFEPGPCHHLSAEAIDDCEILVVRRSAVRQVGANDGRFERQLWIATSKALSRSQQHLLLLGRKAAAEKVAGFLIEVANRSRSECAELTMGRQDMADYLGLTIETVSRMITHLQAEGLVRFETCRRFSIRNRTALARLATD